MRENDQTRLLPGFRRLLTNGSIGTGISTLVLLGTSGRAGGLPPAEETLRRPNVVIFITDDESWLERSAYGWSNLPTPNFDRVAAEGVLFTHGYVSAPSCAPSRATLLTGRNFWELEEGAFIQAWLPSKFPVLPDLMEAGGYHAGYTGKPWGPGRNDLSGRTRNPAGDAYNKIRIPDQEPGLSNIDYAANFEAFLDKRAEAQPFWFWVGCVEPHTPLGPDNPEKLESRYGISLDDVKVPGFLPDTPGVRRKLAAIRYEICHADESLGKIMKILEDRGELDNTLLIMTSDNGTQIPRGKASAYDWGSRVPLAIMWPERVPSGRTVSDFVRFPDLAVTMLEAAGLPVPESMSGRSIMNILLSDRAGQVDPERTWVVHGIEWQGEFPPMNRASRTIRDHRYAYIVNYGRGFIEARQSPEAIRPDSEFEKNAQTDSAEDLVVKHPEHPKVRPFVPLLSEWSVPEELYDLEKDPWQINNVADDPEYADIKAQLKASLEAHQRETGDPRGTGELETFNRTREFVIERKRGGYRD